MYPEAVVDTETKPGTPTPAPMESPKLMPNPKVFSGEHSSLVRSFMSSALTPKYIDALKATETPT